MEDLAQRLNQLRDQLAVRRRVIKQQQGEISRDRPLVCGTCDSAGTDLVVSLVPEEDDWCLREGLRDCSDQRTQQDVCSIDHASTTAGIQALRGRAFVERVATANVQALRPM